MHRQPFERYSKFLLASTRCGLLLLATEAWGDSRSAANAVDCERASTQAGLNACAYEQFLAAQAGMADRLRQLQDAFSAEQRAGLRRVQRAWLGFRTEACAFESRQAGTGSAQPMLQWQCAAVMTRERTAVLDRMANCSEGDLACVRPAANRAQSR